MLGRQAARKHLPGLPAADKTLTLCDLKAQAARAEISLMGLLSKRSGSPDWASESQAPLPPHHPSTRGWLKPGEVCLPPIDVLDWIEATKRLQAPPKDRPAYHRFLFLTDIRLRIVWPDYRKWAEILFADVLKIAVPHLKQPVGRRDRLIQIEYKHPLGDKFVRFAPSPGDLDAFHARLVKHVSRYKLDEFGAGHPGGVHLSSPEFTEALRLRAIAGEWHPPPVIRDRNAERSDLTPPVGSWGECPRCEGPLEMVVDAARCESCGRVWCDPMTSPALGEDGHLIGLTREELWEFSPSQVAKGDHRRVRAYLISVDWDWATANWR